MYCIIIFEWSRNCLLLYISRVSIKYLARINKYHIDRKNLRAQFLDWWYIEEWQQRDLVSGSYKKKMMKIHDCSSIPRRWKGSCVHFGPLPAWTSHISIWPDQNKGQIITVNRTLMFWTKSTNEIDSQGVFFLNFLIILFKRHVWHRSTLDDKLFDNTEKKTPFIFIFKDQITIWAYCKG
jgi:hypothetical protein